MLGKAEATPIEQGHALIEGYFAARYSEIKSNVSEVVEPFVEGLSNEPDEAFDLFAQNVIRGISRAKAFKSRPLQVARRTFAVSKLVMCEAFDHEPSLEVVGVINTYIDPNLPTEHNFIDMYNKLSHFFRQSTGFGTIMLDCQPSIDPRADEPEVFPVIAGFALQSAALGEAKRVRSEIEAAANGISAFSGDLWKLFDQ